jgi:ferredoxin-like protein FixX
MKTVDGIKLTLRCPACDKVLYRNLEEGESFVSAGKCVQCGTLLLFNPKTLSFEIEKGNQTHE